MVAFCVDVAAGAVTWSHLPERVPLHWNLRGQVDRYGSRVELVLFGPVLVLGTWLLLELVRIIDPRTARRGFDDGTVARQEAEGARETIESSLILLMVALHGVLLLVAGGGQREPVRLLALFFAGFLVVVGNFIGRLRPNWFIGIRTPWTLSSEEVWRRTHRLAARVMVVAGVALAPTALTVRGGLAMPVAAAVVLGAVLIPAAWSYSFWRRSNGGGPTGSSARVP